jgi:hypothetical protein
MAKSNIQVNPVDINSTKAFQNLSKIQKKIYNTRSSRLAIQHGVNVSINIGFEAWEKQTNGSWYHQQVVKELFELKTKNQ